MTSPWYSELDLRQEWHWFDLSGDTLDALRRASPADFRWIKTNNDRAVARYRDLFLKFNRLPLWKALWFSPAREEFRAAVKLRRAGIPTVEHLGCARRGGVTLLITRAWHDDAQDLDEFWDEHMVLGEEDPAAFLARFTGFFTDLLHKNLYHKDFHLGNILWSPGAREFTLVDLHHVSLRRTRTVADKLCLLEVLPKFREAAEPALILRMIQISAGLSADAAGQLLRYLLGEERRNVLRQWPRRKAQFLAGYPKYSALETVDGKKLLIRRDRLRRAMFDPARRKCYETERLAPEQAWEKMLFSFFLQLLRVPHRVPAAVAEDGTLYFTRSEGDRPAPRNAVNAFNEYLLCFGLNLDDYQAWRQRPGGGIFIAETAPMLDACPDRALFRREEAETIAK